MSILSLIIFIGGLYTIYMGIRAVRQKDLLIPVGGYFQPRLMSRKGGSGVIIGITVILSGIVMLITASTMWLSNQFSIMYVGFAILFFTQLIGVTFSTISHLFRKILG